MAADITTGHSRRARRQPAAAALAACRQGRAQGRQAHRGRAAGGRGPGGGGEHRAAAVGGDAGLHRRRGAADELDDRHPGVDRRDEPRSQTPPVTWHRANGEIPPEEETDFVMTAATAKVFQKDHLTAVEAGVHGRAGARPVQGHDDVGGDGRHDLAARGERRPPTRTPAELVDDLVALQVAEIAELAALRHALGAARLAVLQPGVRRRVPRGDAEPDGPAASSWPRSVAADTAIVSGIKAANPDVTVGMHICRGNNRCAYMAKGGYEPVAEQLFGDGAGGPVPARVRRRAVRRLRAAALRPARRDRGARPDLLQDAGPRVAGRPAAADRRGGQVRAA